jgi:hypothetical protein
LDDPPAERFSTPLILLSKWYRQHMQSFFLITLSIIDLDNNICPLSFDARKGRANFFKIAEDSENLNRMQCLEVYNINLSEAGAQTK